MYLTCHYIFGNGERCLEPASTMGEHCKWHRTIESLKNGVPKGWRGVWAVLFAGLVGGPFIAALMTEAWKALISRKLPDPLLVYAQIVILGFFLSLAIILGEWSAKPFWPKLLATSEIMLAVYNIAYSIGEGRGRIYSADLFAAILLLILSMAILVARPARFDQGVLTVALAGYLLALQYSESVLICVLILGLCLVFMLTLQYFHTLKKGDA